MGTLVKLGADGRIAGVYDSIISPDIPADAVPVDDAGGAEIRGAFNFSDYTMVNGALVLDDAHVAARLLAAAIPKKIAEIELARDAACLVNVAAHLRQWQADKRSQELLAQAITLASAGLPLPTVWRDADNSNMPITTLGDLLQIAGAIALQTQSAYAQSWLKKSQITAAATIAELEAIIW